MQRHALALLFSVLSLALAGIGVAAIVTTHRDVRWLIALAALAVAGWLGSIALSALRK